jgi:hypothetical protein
MPVAQIFAISMAPFKWQCDAPLCSTVLWLKIEIILNLAWSQVQDIFP